MTWIIERVICFDDEVFLKDGLSHLGFRDSSGDLLALDYDYHRAALIDPEGLLIWTVGSEEFCSAPLHFRVSLCNPMYGCRLPDGAWIVASGGDSKVHHLCPSTGAAGVLIDGQELGLQSMGNCVADAEGSIWINDVTGCAIWRFDYAGNLIEVLGSGEPGFQSHTVPFEKALFHWIYDLRLGPDGFLYVLDSRNYAVRKLDPVERTVSLVAGCGNPGYSGDGEDAKKAALGGDPHSKFDGPWSVAVDEDGSIFIGDTQNCVVRHVDAESGTIRTIAGSPEVGPEWDNACVTDPLKLRLPLICSLDYHNDRLYVPEWEGELVILAKQ